MTMPDIERELDMTRQLIEDARLTLVSSDRLVRQTQPTDTPKPSPVDPSPRVTSTKDTA